MGLFFGTEEVLFNTSSVPKKVGFHFLALSKLKIALKLLKLSAFIFWEMAMACPVNFWTIFKAEI